MEVYILVSHKISQKDWGNIILGLVNILAPKDHLNLLGIVFLKTK